MLEKNKEYNLIYFSGCGFLLPFQLGAVKCLQDNNITFKHLYGTSGGVHACAILSNITSIEKVFQSCFELKQIYKPLTINFFYNNYKTHINDIYDLKSQEKKIHISVFNAQKMEEEWISDFNSQEELVEYTAISSLIPFFTRIFPKYYHGNFLFDSCIMNNRKPPSNITLVISPFLEVEGIPIGKYNVKGNYLTEQIIFIEKDEMEKAFIHGYYLMLQNIREPIVVKPKVFLSKSLQNVNMNNSKYFYVKEVITLCLIIIAILLVFKYKGKKNRV